MAQSGIIERFISKKNFGNYGRLKLLLSVSTARPIVVNCQKVDHLNGKTMGFMSDFDGISAQFEFQRSFYSRFRSLATLCV